MNALLRAFNQLDRYVERVAAIDVGKNELKVCELTASIEVAVAPFQAQVEQLDEVSGIGLICAPDIIAEIGVDVDRFVRLGQPSRLPAPYPRLRDRTGRGVTSQITVTAHLEPRRAAFSLTLSRRMRT
jgi:hypothetical protein